MTLVNSVRFQAPARNAKSPLFLGCPAKAGMLFLCGMLTIDTAFAGDYPSETTSDWDTVLGIGLIAKPTFSGSNRYNLAPIPLVNIKWKDMVSVGYDGINLYWHQDEFRIGAGLVIDQGRDTQHSGTISLRSGDERLRGLGKIDISPGVRVFASYQFGVVNFDVSATQYEGKQNKGLTASLGVSAPFRFDSQFTVTPHAGATWADRKYNQTYYGVTAVQSLNSSFPEFSAHSGMHDVNAGLTLTYAFSEHWFSSVDVSAKQLLGDARRSPISFSDSSVTGMTTIGYHF